MSSKVIVDPITRIEGHLHMETDVDDNGLITGAYSSGTMFRGIEEILKDRDPRDAWAFTQRICGVCTIIHSVASIRAVEDALHYRIPRNARLIRNILSGAQLVQDSVVHFYQLTSPDWMDVTSALKADPARAADLQKCMSDWGNNSEGYFKTKQSTLANFVSAGQLGIFGNAYWGHPAYKLPPELNLILFAHYLEALEWQRRMVKIHAIFGGRNPHPNFLVGGTPCAISTDGNGNRVIGNTATDQNRLELIGSLLRDMNEFVSKVHAPDLLAIARLYPDWFTRGEGLGNFLSFGDYPQDDNGSWDSTPPRLAIPRGAFLWPKDGNGQRLPFNKFRLVDHIYPVDLKDPNEIQEFVAHTWLNYQGGRDLGLHPFEGETTPRYTGPKEAYAPHKPLCEGGQLLYDQNRAREYSWLKTPRWKNNAMEVGRLARIINLYANEDAHTQSLLNQALAHVKQPLSAMFSTMGRMLAEGLDTQITGAMTQNWFDELVKNIEGGDFATHNPELFDPSTWPDEASGVGYTEAPRGALGHWVKIKNGKIASYQCVVPTTWNASPRDPDGNSSAYEAALQDGQHQLAIVDQPLEILRTIHSFDPCMACAVHVMDTRGQERLRVKVRG